MSTLLWLEKPEGRTTKEKKSAGGRVIDGLCGFFFKLAFSVGHL